MFSKCSLGITITWPLLLGHVPGEIKCSYIVRGIDDVLSAVTLCVSAGYEIAKRATVVFWCVAMHSGYFSLSNGKLDKRKNNCMAGALGFEPRIF
jgi:hypothetical protein